MSFGRYFKDRYLLFCNYVQLSDLLHIPPVSLHKGMSIAAGLKHGFHELIFSPTNVLVPLKAILTHEVHTVYRV